MATAFRIEPLATAVLPPVSPREASIVVRHGSAEVVVGLAIYFGVVALGAAIAMRRLAPDNVLPAALLILVLGGFAALGVGGLVRLVLRRSREARAAIEQQELQREYDREYAILLAAARTEADQRARAEANKRTQEAQLLLEKIQDLRRRSNAHLREAERQLAVANGEFQATAYAPFWDAVEAAALNLDKLASCLRALPTAVGAYRKLLTGRQHTFPLNVVNPKALPQPEDQLRQFRALVRLGQTDISFATIWEHRRTREVLIAGFRTLAEGIANIEETVRVAMRDLIFAVDEQRGAIVTEAHDISLGVSAVEAIQQESLELQREASERRRRHDLLT